MRGKNSIHAPGRGMLFVNKILYEKSRAPKPGIWLMRGAQPATSAGARLFAGSPIPAPSPPLVAAKKLRTHNS
jgi:hypothetical protein